MKRRGILNVHLSAVLASLGHTDRIAIGDCGLPIPERVETVDLALVAGVPRFDQVLTAVASEIVVERLTVAEPTETRNPPAWQTIRESFRGVDIDTVAHDDLKAMLPEVRAVVRTGEATPYANVVLHCGVAF